MNRFFKIFLLVVLSVFSTLNLSANDTFFSIEKSSSSVKELAEAGDDVLLAAVKGKFPNISTSWFDDVSEALLKKMDDLPISSISKFEADIASANGSALKNLFKNNPKLIDAWEIIRRNIDKFRTTTTKFALDEAVLNNVSDLMQDGSNFRNAFGGNWQTKLDEIIKVNKDLRCPTCLSVNGNPLGLSNIPPLNEVLENLEYICQYNVPGLETVVNSMRNSLSGARDGVNFMISAIKKNPNNYTGITAFEFKYADGIYNNTADAMMGSIKMEFKSWSPTNPQVWGKFFSGVQTNNFTSYTQFLRYLENSASLGEIKYVFNINKVDITTVKNAFKDLFIAKADDMFKTVDNGGLGISKMKQLFEFNNFTFNNATQFKNLLNNNVQFRNNVLKFIKVE